MTIRHHARNGGRLNLRKFNNSFIVILQYLFTSEGLAIVSTSVIFLIIIDS